MSKRSLVAALCVGLAWTPLAHGQQGRWTVDSKSSLAWWQVVPHMHHLFGTTCPQDPSFVPGWGRDGGSAWNVDVTMLKLPEVWDTLRMPLFSRQRVRPICAEAVQGEIVVPDSLAWQGVHGNVVISAKAIASGQSLRDKYMQGLILESAEFPDIQFTLDSVVGVTRIVVDTVRGTAVGKLLVRGVSRQMSGRFTARREAGGVRVISKFHFPAGDLTEHFNMSKWALGLGVSSGIWKDVWEGVDMLLRPAASSSPSP